MMTSNPENPTVVSREEWLTARKRLLVKEKELTRTRDALRAERRQLPWVRVDKNYVFDTLQGKKTLADLFDGCSQLIVNHFMMGPGWKEGCVGCSFGVDHIEGALVHLEAHDVSYVAVSRAPLAEIEAFRQRMGWKLTWVSSYGSDFNFDYHVSFTPEQIANGRVDYNYEMGESRGDEASGLSVFYKDQSGQVFHTYSSYARGNEELLGTYVHLDITPKGRNENGPNYNLTDWVRHHDRYNHAGTVDRTGRYVAMAESDAYCHSAQEQPAAPESRELRGATK